MSKTDNKDKEFREIEEKFDRIFDSVAHVNLQVSPGFKDRVLKLSRGRRVQPSRPRVWQPLAATALTLALGAIAFSFWESRGAYETQVFQQVAIRLDIRSHVQEGQCNVRIRLPHGVQFSSKTHPEIAQNSSLELPCGGATVAGILPIVLQGTEEGLKKVDVRFVGSDQHELAQATYKIRFKKGSEQA